MVCVLAISVSSDPHLSVACGSALADTGPARLVFDRWYVARKRDIGV